MVERCSINCAVCECSCLYCVSPVSHQNDKFIILLQNNSVMAVWMMHLWEVPEIMHKVPAIESPSGNTIIPFHQNIAGITCLLPYVQKTGVECVCVCVCVCVCDGEELQKWQAVCLLSPGSSHIPLPCVWLVVFIFLLQVPTSSNGHWGGEVTRCRRRRRRRADEENE